MGHGLFDRLLKSAEEIVHTFTLPDVKKIRLDNRLKQQEFANVLGVSVAFVKSWELDRRVPNGPALKLLLMLEQQLILIEKLKVI